MKQSTKLFWILSVVMILAFQAEAQVKVNPKVGVNISGLESTLNDFKAEGRIGWNAGLDFRMGQGVFFFNPGLHYYNYTARLVSDYDLPTDLLEGETTIQNIKMPVNVGISLTGQNRFLNIYAKGGVTPTYTLGVKEQSIFSLNRDDLEPWAFGANLGVGVDLWFLTVDATYEIGLTPFFKNADGNNNMLTLSAGLRF